MWETLEQADGQADKPSVPVWFLSEFAYFASAKSSAVLSPLSSLFIFSLSLSP